MKLLDILSQREQELITEIESLGDKHTEVCVAVEQVEKQLTDARAELQALQKATKVISQPANDIDEMIRQYTESH